MRESRLELDDGTEQTRTQAHLYVGPGQAQRVTNLINEGAGCDRTARAGAHVHDTIRCWTSKDSFACTAEQKQKLGPTVKSDPFALSERGSDRPAHAARLRVRRKGPGAAVNWPTENLPAESVLPCVRVSAHAAAGRTRPERMDGFSGASPGCTSHMAVADREGLEPKRLCGSENFRSPDRCYRIGQLSKPRRQSRPDQRAEFFFR